MRTKTATNSARRNVRRTELGGNVGGMATNPQSASAPQDARRGGATPEKTSFGAKSSGSVSAKEAVFSFDAASARQVLLAGDFTGWTKAPINMEKDARGLWNASLTLPPGRHPYRFLVDGEWHDDPRCYQRVPNPFGTFDSIIEI